MGYARAGSNPADCGIGFFLYLFIAFFVHNEITFFFCFMAQTSFDKNNNVKDKIATNSITTSQTHTYLYGVHEFRVEKTDGFGILSDFFRIPLDKYLLLR